MVTVRSRARNRSDFSGGGEEHQIGVTGKDGVSEYELSREERIKENQERMQKLGILDLSQKLVALKSATSRVSRRKSHLVKSPVPYHQGPVRRSSRLQNSTPVSYCEVRKIDHVLKKEKGFPRSFLMEEGAKPEIYTEEHEKLLGSTEKMWILFVDGYGKDGKRIYDPIKGKTCHQCRQKTLGHRTQCCRCQMVQGQFCGDCLFMRYGENVLEANENPDWICPCCRGICNCSLCRQAKGWPPTGPLYRKISSLGYKSVAHYLIQTRRHDTAPDEYVSSKAPVSAKRSLPFSDIDPEAGTEEDISIAPTTEPVTETAADFEAAPLSPDAKKPDLKHSDDKERREAAITQIAQRSGTTEIMTETTNASDTSHIITPLTRLKAMKKRILFEPLVDSIAGRLRQRRAAH